MTLGGDIAQALPELRAVAESAMRAKCRITRADVPVWNPVTLQNDTQTFDVYVGRCRIRAAGTQDAALSAADQAFLESRYVLSLPITGTGAVARNDVVEITADPTDKALVGRKFTISSVPAQSDAVSRRLPVEETR